jgi:hypothetical protein
MERVWYYRDQEGVVAALKRGERPDLATTMGSGPLDELVGLHEELGIFPALDALPTQRERRGVDDDLLLRTVAVLPFLETASLSGAAAQLFREPAVLLHLGWSPLQIQIGDNERHRDPAGRQPGSLPCHPDTLRDALRRVEEEAWLDVQRLGVRALFEHRLVRGRVYAIDGTGLGDGLRLVCLVCVSAERPVIVAWRLLTGSASEKGKEAAVTRSLIEQAVELGGPGCIELLLVDALYADGPLLAWLKYCQEIDVLVPIPSDREIHRDLQGLARAGMLKFRRHSYVRAIQGHKQRRTLDISAQQATTSWDSFVEAARAYGDENPHLWACLICPVEPTAPDDKPWTLVSTRAWSSGAAAFQAFRPRWHIENDTYRELKEGWRLEAERWGRDVQVQRGRVTLTCLAFNTAQVYLSRSGGRLAARGIRRLRRQYQPQLGAAPVVSYIGRAYAVLPVEELLRIVGFPTRQSLLPRLHPARPP